MTILVCPKCESEQVVVTAEQQFMVNTDEHYCHSVKTQDTAAKVICLECWWECERIQLEEKK